MSQNPLAPPPQTGGPLDNWLYLLWRRLTQAGQILWASITPGTSADVAAVVTDETGSPGSLVFSNNPTLTGLTVSGAAFTSRGITDNATATAVTIDSIGRVLTGVTSAFDISPSGTGQYPVIGSFSASSQFPYVSGYFGNDAISANWTAIKSRSGTPGEHATVSSGDQIGGFLFRGDDGTYFRNCASIYAYVDGTTASNQMPGRLIFQVSPAGAAATMVEKMRIDSAGNVTLGGVNTAPALKVTPVASQARWVEVTGATSSGNPTIGVSGGILAVSASVAITGVVSTSGYTVATLPAGTVGQRAYVTDALAPAYAAAVVGGGAVTVPVFYNGAAWICA